SVRPAMSAWTPPFAAGVGIRESKMDTAYSPGLEGVVAGETAISRVDEGLQYRGYAIEELARESSFEEVAYLLLLGELPTRSQLDTFWQLLTSQRALPAEIE